MNRLLLLSGILLSAATTHAQEPTRTTTVRIEEQRGDSIEKTTIVVAEGDTIVKKKRTMISLGPDGLIIKRKEDQISSGDSVRAKPNPRFKLQYGMLDLGFNRLNDRTENKFSYADPTNPSNPLATQDEIFRLRESKSVNVNVWIVNGRLRLSESRRQKWYMTTGLGLQMYNFRFTSPYQYSESSPVIPAPIDPAKYALPPYGSVSFQKNKLGFTYASIPLGLLGKTRIGSKWLVYGGGVMGGLRVASWTKLKTEAYGKEKTHDAFNFKPFNACVYGELGIDHIIRLYGTYQLTPLNKGVIDQYPFAIGVRFIGL